LILVGEDNGIKPLILSSGKTATEGTYGIR
jgi:hypothetical protein